MTEATQISADEAIARGADGAWLLDVREQDEWDAGHAPSANLIPMGQLMDRIDEVPDDAEVLVICHSGYRSWVVTKALVAAGYDAVNVAGGMEAWESAGGVVVRDGRDSRQA
ncbi:MAG TPA: rhodanese-like domain-containing protein [Galbitalea sp.]|jgi:rhodanese-related sulfurtransferase|nr:rhodanese-like domain-containing protein [Galbitalea sp.]